MKVLIQAELLRFKKPIFLMAVFHMLFLAFIYNANWLLDGIASYYHVALFANLLFATGLGWFQFRSMVQKNRWAFYIHRPVSRFSMFSGFALSALSIFALSSVLPLAIGFLSLDGYIQGVIDTRFYLLVPFILGLMMCCWFAAVFAVLSPSRLSFLAFVLPGLLMNSDGHGYWVFLTLALVLLWLGSMAYMVFKPSLESHADKPSSVITIAAPIQYALSLILTWGFTTIFQMGLIVFDKNHNGSWNDYWQPGHYNHTAQMNDPELLSFALQSSGLPEVPAATYVGYDSLKVEFYKPMLRNQLFFMDKPLDKVGRVWLEQEGVNWYFSHDQMMFFGIRGRDNRFVGWIDRHGNVTPELNVGKEQPRFGFVPKTLDGADYYIENQGYRLHDGQIEHFVSIDKGEYFISGVKAIEQGYAVLSNSHFYLFDNAMQRRAKIELNASWQNLTRVNTAYVDGKIYVSALTGRLSDSNYYASQLAFYQVDADGQVNKLGTRELLDDWSEIYRYRGFIVSPLMKYFHEVLWLNLKPYQKPDVTNSTVLTQSLPTNVIWSMLLLGLISMVLTLKLAGNTRLSKQNTYVWAGINALVGLPGLISFIFLNHFDNVRKPNTS